ncbi:MAG TPA: F0F1 ATP synthase subunit epsilon [Candidatus Moranbacteria bacterium]|nr:F0F1 ATP synthase subunit epsilon [Candidatus Moranbacteria bacterium]
MVDLNIKFKIVTPERTVFEDTVDQITLPTTDGEVTILPNHRSYIASLKTGELMLRKGKEENYVYVSGGFIEFNNNELIVLADAAERAEEIDLKIAEEAKKRAEEIKKQKITLDDTEYARVAAAIERETARIRVAKKHFTKRGMNLDN